MSNLKIYFSVSLETGFYIRVTYFGTRFSKTTFITIGVEVTASNSPRCNYWQVPNGVSGACMHTAFQNSVPLKLGLFTMAPTEICSPWYANTSDQETSKAAEGWLLKSRSGFNLFRSLSPHCYTGAGQSTNQRQS